PLNRGLDHFEISASFYRGGCTKLTAQLLGCKIFQNKTIHRKFTYGRSGEERNIYSYYNKKAYINILKYFHSLI
ncbi:MAG: hypothetical protein ACK53Y_02495, partial [bacterium]